MPCGTITRSYTKTLHDAFTENATSRHLCHRLDIDNNTLHSIAWTEFHRAIKSFSPGHKRTIRKWLFGYLPTQRRLARYKHSSTDACPICQQHPETDEHFLTCGGSANWQDFLFEPLARLFSKYQTHRHFETTLTTQLKLFLNNNMSELSIQSDIGWKALFTGLFHKHWITLHNQHSTQPNGSMIITKIIRIVLSAVIQRWKARCLALHQTTPGNIETRTRLQHQIRALYSCRQYILQEDLSVFVIPLQQLLQQSTLTLKLFVSQYKPIIKHSIHLQTEQLKRQHRDIATYFIRNT